MRNKLLTIIMLLPLFWGCLTPKSSNSQLKINSEIATGTLENGLTYFIQENKKPENRIELRLVVDVGSIQEEDDQRGLAHFVEHMAFNGTKNFPKDELINYLESLGMGFGPEINAYTSFDETVYKLSIPADDPEVLEKAFLILQDWSNSITFDDEEIEKERGVIVEEWRGGRGVSGRYIDKLFPTLLKDSKYADRLPIGDVEIIQNCPPQRLRDYYKKWYRPDLMSLSVVGNIDVEKVKSYVESNFNFEHDGSKADRGVHAVPLLDRIDVEIISDPEMTSSKLKLFIKEKSIVVDDVESYRKYINQFLFSIMFNGRMEEIAIKPEAPFLNAAGGYGSFLRDVGLLSFSVGVEDDKTVSGFEALLIEIEKVKQNGFTEVELERAKSQVEMIMKNIYNERENKLSTSVIGELVDYYLHGNVPMNIAEEVELLSSVLNEITLYEVNSVVFESLKGKDRTLTVHIPESENVEKLSKNDFVNLFTTVSSNTYSQRSEEVITRELFEKDLVGGAVKSREHDEELGITTITLSNNAKVILKPTDFKADEIMFSAVSFGGLSLVGDSEFRSGEVASNLAITSGLNGFDSISLDRILTGKNAKASPWIDNYTEGITGSSNKEDKEILLQLINLYFTEPSFSKDSFEVLLKNMESSVVNRENSPKQIFFDRVSEILARGHFRAKPVTLETLKEIDFEESKKIYEERFADPGDFYFIFTGSFEEENLLPLISKYIGSIPSTGANEKAKDLGLKFPEGIVEDVVIKGIEDQTVVEVIFNGEYDGPKKDELGLEMLSGYLEDVLRVKIREELSGTYGVSVFSTIRHYPAKKYAFGIYFGCEPGREDELITAVFKEIEKLKNGEVKKPSVDSVVNNYTRTMELNLKSNDYWHNSITNNLLLERDFKDITDTDVSDIDSSRIVDLANKYINEERYVKVILKPEGK